jgi:hypothetical protein
MSNVLLPLEAERRWKQLQHFFAGNTKQPPKIGILKQVFRGDVTKHGTSIRVCAIIAQLAIEGGEALFQVDYEDPDLDNLYFEDENEDDENIRT